MTSPTSTPAHLRNRVDAAFASLSPARRRVAMLLVHEHGRLGFHSAADLGRLAGTSDATVIRTVQALGYQGLVELKEAVAGELSPAGPTDRLRTSIGNSGRADGDRVLLRRLRAQAGAINSLAEPDVQAAIANAVEVIGSAERTLVNARGVSTGIAEYAAAQLLRLGIDARVLGSAAGITADDLLNIGAGDAVVVVASGTPPLWLALLQERARQLGAGVVLLTDSIVPLDRRSVVIRSGRGEPGATASHVTTVAVLEAIVIGLAARDPTGSTSTLSELERLRRQLDVGGGQ